MKPISLKIFMITFVSLLLINSGCSRSNQFEKSCLNILDIFTKTAQLVVVTEARNDMGVNGKVDSTNGLLDISKAKEYLNSKKNELTKNYEIIKSSFDQKNEKYYDALFVLAFVNDQLYRYSGQPIEDPCIYFKIIKGKQNLKMSNWIKDEFFGRFIYKKNTINSWNQMDKETKSSMIYKLLLIPGGSSERC